MTALLFTKHAIERYVSRCAPHMTLTEARRYLDSCAASKMKEKTDSGESYFSLPDCVAVVKFDPKIRRAVAVTIVPAGELIEESELTKLYDEVLAEKAEVHARRVQIEAEPRHIGKLSSLREVGEIATTVKLHAKHVESVTRIACTVHSGKLKRQLKSALLLLREMGVTQCQLNAHNLPNEVHVPDE